MSRETIETVLQAAQQPARDRTERFAARMDEHLGNLRDDAARADFCRQQLQRWIDLYEDWCRAVDSGRIEIKPNGATAWDYTLTIAAIDQRKAKYDRAAAMVPA